MARLASQAVAGYFPTPLHLIAPIARLIKTTESEQEEGGRYSYRVKYNEWSIVDPCAGEGAAVLALAGEVFGEEALRSRRVKFYANELEESRYKALCANLGGDYSGQCVTHGDAFSVQWETGDSKDGASVLFLNPPYDLDKEHGRLEQRFLQRFTATLKIGGALVFVVPFYALAASAAYLATHYEELRCFRFPAADFAGFKQVVLIGKRREERLAPDSDAIALVNRWALDATSAPELPTRRSEAVIEITASRSYRGGLDGWKVAALDVAGIVARFKPWQGSDRVGKLRPITGIMPSGPVSEALLRRFPVAMPPKPAHIAAGIAAGVFNGERISATNPGLPDLLVKGTFDREFVTIDEKENKEGEKTGEVQVQQPRLVITVLDLESKKLHTVESSAEITDARTVAEMTTADLLGSYGPDLMEVMLRNCPVMDASDVELAPVAREPYRAQARCVQAAVKMLSQGQSCYLIGEVGSGKSQCAIQTSETLGGKRTLVMCPPHLLKSWTDQVATVAPWVRTVVLHDVSDVEALAATDDRVIAILSRETAKLGHGYEAVGGGSCPKCGSPLPPGDLAKRRATCEATRLIALDARARACVEIATAMLRANPKHDLVEALFSERLRAAYGKRPRKLDRSAMVAAVRSLRWYNRYDTLCLMLAAIGDDELTAAVSPWVFAVDTYSARESARSMLLMIRDPRLQDQAEQVCIDLGADEGTTYGYATPWQQWRGQRDRLRAGDVHRTGDREVSRANGVLSYGGRVIGSLKAAEAALDALRKLGQWGRTPECGERLYQAVPSPRRVPLATFIAKRHPDLFDFFIADEAHELANSDSAQSQAGHRIVALGIPTLMLTGSVMGGYAESLFANQWALDPQFRAEFSRDQRAEFVRRYGYLKQLVEDRDRDTGKVVEFGSMSDRVERKERTIGQAPGVLPLFVLKYLLRNAVTLHKSDLALDLPQRSDHVDRSILDSLQSSNLDRMRTALIQQIKHDRFDPDLAGKLLGALGELPSYLDRCTVDVGNRSDGSYVVAYPDDCGGATVASADGMPSDTILPKERWMLDLVRAELAEGRRAMVLCWHVELMPRLARLLREELGEACPMLVAKRVKSEKREAWIDKEVVGKGARVMLVNPVAVQTGLNNLVWFSTQIWMENPMVNAIVFRQATGRIDRIGQRLPPRIYFPVYEGLQEATHKLLLHKVGVSMATDGLDAESALAAAGVGDSGGFSAMSVGRQLFEILEGRAAA